MVQRYNGAMDWKKEGEMGGGGEMEMGPFYTSSLPANIATPSDAPALITSTFLFTGT
jgi:hypothetical protein